MGGLRMSAPRMSAPGILEREQIGDSRGHGGWVVVVYDNDVNTIDEVLYILMLATGCSQEEAEIETWEVHHLGKSVVHCADQEECEGVAAVIATIGIRVECREE